MAKEAPTLSDLPDFPALRQVQHALWGSKDLRGAAVMVGAGFSRFARLASQDGRSPPLWGDFATEMRKRLDGENLPNDPLVLAEQYGVALGRHALDALIRELVSDHQWTPGELHSRLLGLPWADVLTTNWDTLLERTQLQEPDRSYEVVRVISDIARTRAPRIVKLHGSLPAHEPFTFTAEDFRTYPRRFAPFVNLAQQVLLENELCLIGFSGDDPNFLQWSGWVRDQLGVSARKIRLIGVLNLSPSRRQVLERHNISPIDLAPLVEGYEPGEKHHRAMTMFIDSLWAAKPKPSHVWSRRPLAWKTGAVDYCGGSGDVSAITSSRMAGRPLKLSRLADRALSRTHDGAARHVLAFCRCVSGLTSGNKRDARDHRIRAGMVPRNSFHPDGR